jgi:hypothetical protein
MSQHPLTLCCSSQPARINFPHGVLAQLYTTFMLRTFFLAARLSSSQVPLKAAVELHTTYEGHPKREKGSRVLFLTHPLTLRKPFIYCGPSCDDSFGCIFLSYHQMLMQCTLRDGHASLLSTLQFLIRSGQVSTKVLDSRKLSRKLSSVALLASLFVHWLNFDHY